MECLLKCNFSLFFWIFFLIRLRLCQLGHLVDQPHRFFFALLIQIMFYRFNTFMLCEHLYFLLGKEFGLRISQLIELLPLLLNLPLHLYLEIPRLLLRQLFTNPLLNRLLLSNHFSPHWRPLDILLLLRVYVPA